MNRTEFYKARNAFADWICSHSDFDTFITLTLKQGLPCSTYRGRIVPISRGDCIKVARIFRDRMSRTYLGVGRVRGGHRLPIAAFVEGNEFIRMHLHFIAKKPTNTTLTDFRMAICQVAHKLEWAHDRVDTRPITFGKPEFVANYCLKDGTDAFLLEASSLPGRP